MDKNIWQFPDRNNLQNIEQPHSMQNWVYPIILRQDKKFRAIGTCFQLTKNRIFATAAHVFKDAVPELENGTFFGQKLDRALFILIGLYDQEVNDYYYVMAKVGHSVVSNDFDIAVFTLTHSVVNPRTQKPAILSLVPIKLEVPSIGGDCAAIGYHSMEWEPTIEATIARNELAVTMGIIQEVYIPRRDNMLPFPCFRTNARFNSGMSGGPVLGSTGKLIGIVCSGFNKLEQDDEDLSYASLIAPAMMIKFPTWNERREETFILEHFSWDDNTSEMDKTTTIAELHDGGARLGILNPLDGALHVYNYPK